MLRTRPEYAKYTHDNAVKALYKNKTASEEFIVHNTTVLNTYLKLKELYGEHSVLRISNGSQWIIMLNSLEGSLRQRFSLAHEFKHVMDHSVRHFMYHDFDEEGQSKQAEQIADYFAGCLLMPKQHVKSLYYNHGIQRPSELSECFHVSPKAIQFRLHQIGITPDATRCGGAGIRPTYYRQKQYAGALA